MKEAIAKKDIQALSELFEVLHDAGHEAYLVGGCVRDMILGIAPSDYDISTSAKPEEVESLFPNTNPIGKRFGTIQVVLNQGVFEVTSFRKDFGYSDSRRPDHVIFGNLEEDAMRRDFTMNAIYYDLVKEKLKDPCKGKKDIQAKVIRFIGDAKTRIYEDRLRLLRAVRFQSQLGFDLDDKAISAINTYAKDLEGVSWERIHVELKKWLKGKYIEKSFSVIDSSRLFEYLFGKTSSDLSWIKGLQDFSDSTLYACFVAGLNLNTDPSDIKMSREEVKSFQSFKRLIKNNFDETDILIHYSNPVGSIAKSYLTINKPDHKLLQVFSNTHPHHHELPEALVNGKDLIDEGLVSGKFMGEELDRLYKIQIEKGIQSKVELLKYLKK